MQRLLFMARRTRCPRGCVVSGHWCVIPSTDRSIHGAVEKSMPNPVRKPICPLENWPPKVCTSDPEAQSYPCITRTEYVQHVTGFWFRCTDQMHRSIKLPSFQGCSFWVAASSHINQSKSSHLSSVSFFSVMAHTQLIFEITAFFWSN